jgi:hypothetical protein
MSGNGGKEYVDGMLVDWGAALFNQGSVSTVAGGKGRTSLARPSNEKGKAEGGVLKRGGPGEIAASAARIRSKLGAIAKRSPEVMVKITPGAPRGMRQIKRHLDYISRKGEIPLEDQEGNVLLGKEALQSLRDDWQYGGAFIGDEEGKLREAFHVVFSMPEGTDELAVKRAVRDFAAKEFAGHQYVMAMHTFDTDPDPEPSRHPHVHLAVKARNDENGRRLNPRKEVLVRWREGFAEALNANGIEATATKRLQRLKRERGEKQSTRQMKERGRRPEQIGKSRVEGEAVQMARAKENQTINAYRQLCNVLSQSEDINDRKLAIGVARRISEGRSAGEIASWAKERNGGSTPRGALPPEKDRGR